MKRKLPTVGDKGSVLDYALGRSTNAKEVQQKERGKKSEDTQESNIHSGGLFIEDGNDQYAVVEPKLKSLVDYSSDDD